MHISFFLNQCKYSHCVCFIIAVYHHQFWTTFSYQISLYTMVNFHWCHYNLYILLFDIIFSNFIHKWTEKTINDICDQLITFIYKIVVIMKLDHSKSFNNLTFYQRGLKLSLWFWHGKNDHPLLITYRLSKIVWQHALTAGVIVHFSFELLLLGYDYHFD